MGEVLKPNYIAALKVIRNYLAHKGRTPSIRELQLELGYAWPRSAAHLLEKLEQLGFVKRRSGKSIQLIRDLEDDNYSAKTVNVPLVGSVSCGSPLLAEENYEGLIPVSTKLAKPPHKYFLLKARGDSMNEAGIEDGSFVLVRQQATAHDGQDVVALVDNEATIKRLRRVRDAIRLEPVSSNPEHELIILQRNFRVQGIVVGTV